MKKFLTFSLIIVLALAVTAFASLALIYNSQTLDAAKLEARADTLQIYDSQESLVVSANDYRAVSVTEMPEHIKWSFICVEDKDFYKHNGLSYGRIIKAAFKNASAGSAKEGASTISQQLIKNTHLSHEKTMKRKIREAVLARKLEKRYTKDQILDMYLNAIYFGNGIYGLESAAQFYYGKNAANLSARESAGLAGMLKSPARFNPLTRMESFNQRTDLVLGMMHAQGKITQAQYDSAKVEEIVIKGVRQKNDSTAYKQAVMAQASKISGKSVAELAAAGYKVYTFFDAETQNAIDNVARDESYQIKNVSDTVADSCIIAATPQGHITGLYTNNQSLLSGRRNFASSIKPLVVYAPAIELGVVQPSTIIMDEPYASGDFHPKNHDDKFRGEVTVRESVAQSYNIPAVKVLEYTQVSRATDVARGLGLTLDDENLSLALGNTCAGTSFTELLGGYCALSNNGLKTSPSFVKRIETRDGQKVWEYTEPYVRALSESTCITVTDMLKDAANDGTAKKLGSLNFDVAAKTGTAERDESTTNTDAINVSYTPAGVLVVWHGNADMRPENDLPQGTSGGGLTSFMARDILKSITKQDLKFKPYHEIAPTSAPLEKTLSIILDGKIGDTGAPQITFRTKKDTTYEIHKRVGNNTSLLEVIKNNESEYTYIDKNAIKGKVIEYWVTAGDVKSNTVKIFAAEDINKDAKIGKRPNGKHWFF